MEIKTIIGAKPDFKKTCTPEVSEGYYLNIAEFFCDTIQGEGVNMGVPAAFLRMQYCTQNCIWCDTQEVWRFGNPYCFPELFDLMDKYDMRKKFQNGQHLVLTGGSPLRQQEALVKFIKEIWIHYNTSPTIEIENECTLMPSKDMMRIVDVWNNSPKLSNSGNPKALRYQPEILRMLSILDNSWFKFVITGESDWKEIERDFLDPGLINREQIILMPEGADQERLNENKKFVVDMAIQQNVRYSTRMQVDLWNTATGV
jgi:organic radical activating enzyme